MVLQLPYGLSVVEFSDLQKAYKNGYFTPGKTAQSKPLKTKNLSEIAEEAGKTKEAYSRTLSNARRKILSQVGAQIFPGIMAD
jgi:predicted DNA binding protein